MSLSILLSDLTALSKFHQFFHWRTKGTLSYADHLLAERLYNETNDLIDSIAERCVGLEGADSIDEVRDAEAVSKLLAGWKELRAQHSLPEVALKAVKDVIADITELKHDLEKDQSLTEGTDNLLQGVCDVLETHCYLLQQRTASTKTVCISKRAHDVPDDIIIKELERMRRERKQQQEDNRPRVYIEDVEPEDEPAKEDSTKEYDPRVDFEVRLDKHASTEEYEAIAQRVSIVEDEFRAFNYSLQRERFNLADKQAKDLMDSLTQLRTRLHTQVARDMRKGMSPDTLFLTDKRAVLAKLDDMLKEVRQYTHRRELKRDLRDTQDVAPNLAPVIIRKHDRNVIMDPRELKEGPVTAHTTLDKLLKVAYHLDQKQLYAEADRIDRMIETLAKRVGLTLNDYVAAANFMDEIGATEAADTIDAILSNAASIVEYQPELQAPKTKLKAKDEVQHLEVQPLKPRINEKVWKELELELAKEEGKTVKEPTTPEEEQQKWEQLMPETMKALREHKISRR